LIEINDARAIEENGRHRLNAETQLLVLMWCRTVDIGAHHACWLLLQALFITASVPTVTSTTATSTIIYYEDEPGRLSGQVAHAR
jgi:hypothetical protein